MSSHSPNRRDFLQAGAAGLAAAGLAGSISAAQDRQTNEQGIPLRPFGRYQNELVTLIALGGHHSGRASEAEDVKLIRKAVDEGITFLDNAWDYHDGGSEERMGKAIAEGKLRDKVFLMTKVCARDAKTARQQLDESLKRLRTDHLDLWQFHEINYGNDPEWVFEPGGAIEVGIKAKEQGKIRYLGFTGHKDPALHLKMLEQPYEWDSVQMPLNVLDASYKSFQGLVLPKLVERGIAPIGMKSLGGAGELLKGAGIAVEDALRFVLSLPIASLVSGIDSEEILQQNLRIVRDFKPMSEAERRELAARHHRVATDGRYEKFKSTQNYDGPYHKEQHGFSV